MHILEFKPDRIGHFNYFDDEMLDLLEKKKIPLEVCPTSNFLTLKLQNLKQHHFGKIYAKGCPMSICTDDPGVFQTNLSKEMFEIFKAFDFDYGNLIVFLKRSLDCVLEDEVRRYIEKKWKETFGTDF